MGRRPKYKARDIINGFTIISKEGHKDLWKVKHTCGSVFMARPSAIRKQKSCRQCMPSGFQHHAWKGCGEISHDLFTTYKHSAAAKGLEFSVTIDYLWNLFLLQNKKCALTGEELFFNKTYRGKSDKTASPDRINSKLGYVEGNIQWVHRDVNKLKKNLPNGRFIQICVNVANYIKREHE